MSVGPADHFYHDVIVVKPKDVSGQHDFFSFCEFDVVDGSAYDRLIGFHDALGGALGRVCLEVLVNFSHSFAIGADAVIELSLHHPYRSDPLTPGF